MADVARGIHDKLVRRHPHVFGDVVADETADVMRNWEQIKKEEKGTTSIVEGITPGLPSLLYTHKLFRKAASVGLDPGDARRGARPHRRRGRAVCAPATTTSRPTSRSCSPPRSWSRAPAASTPSPRCAAGPRATAAASRRWSTSPLARDLDLAALDPPAVAALWLESAPTSITDSTSRAPAEVDSTDVQRGSTAGMVPMRPALKSSTAWTISSRVFITNGP